MAASGSRRRPPRCLAARSVNQPGASSTRNAQPYNPGYAPVGNRDGDRIFGAGASAALPRFRASDRVDKLVVAHRFGGRDFSGLGSDAVLKSDSSYIERRAGSTGRASSMPTTRSSRPGHRSSDHDMKVERLTDQFLYLNIGQLSWIVTSYDIVCGLKRERLGRIAHRTLSHWFIKNRWCGAFGRMAALLFARHRNAERRQKGPAQANQ